MWFMKEYLVIKFIFIIWKNERFTYGWCLIYGALFRKGTVKIMLNHTDNEEVMNIKIKKKKKDWSKNKNLHVLICASKLSDISNRISISISDYILQELKCQSSLLLRSQCLKNLQ